MKRRSFLGAAIGSVFGGLSIGREQAATITIASFDNSRPVVYWDENEQCWGRFPHRYRQWRKYEINGAPGLETRCCERSPWYRGRGAKVECDHCASDMREAIRLIESGEVTKHGTT
jgi:hypothetical protein